MVFTGLNEITGYRWFVVWLTVQIALVFGARILDYVFNLCEGKFDYLERLSDKLLLKIICYLDLEDIARLSQTSSRFAKVTVPAAVLAAPAAPRALPLTLGESVLLFFLIYLGFRYFIY